MSGVSAAQRAQRLLSFSNWSYVGAMATHADVAVPAVGSAREAAFVGRSNAGKSSLLNKLVGSNKLGAPATRCSTSVFGSS
eukprot:COSAG05_NODE_4190_length_1629_cov_37.392157_2_plen_81_part_00